VARRCFESQSSHALPGAPGGRPPIAMAAPISETSWSWGGSSPLKLRKRGRPSDEVEPKGLARSTPLVETTRPVDTPGDMMRKSKSARNRLHVETQEASREADTSSARARTLPTCRPPLGGRRGRAGGRRGTSSAPPATLRFSSANRLHRQQPDREARPLSHWPLPPPVAVCAMAGGGGYRTIGPCRKRAQCCAGTVTGQCLAPDQLTY
jgi:hypothetical protein